jgi:hypothetical protein
MTAILKTTDQLQVADLLASRVWEYVNPDETVVSPVQELPVRSLAGRLVGTTVHLKNGKEKWAVLANLRLSSPYKTKHGLAVWIENDGRWFELARYFDVDYERRGPDQLAAFLGLPLDEVFPIVYDISDVAIGHPDVVKGTILREPEERLSEDELIGLALEPDEG